MLKWHLYILSPLRNLIVSISSCIYIIVKVIKHFLSKFKQSSKLTPILMVKNQNIMNMDHDIDRIHIKFIHLRIHCRRQGYWIYKSLKDTLFKNGVESIIRFTSR